MAKDSDNAGAPDPIGDHHEDLRQQVDHAIAQLEAVNDRIERRAGRNLFQAVGVGVVIGGALLLSLIFLKWVFVAVAMAASATGAIELSTALRHRDVYVPRFGAAAASILPILGAAFFGPVGVFAGTGAGIVLLLVWYGVERMFGRNYARMGGSHSVRMDALCQIAVVIYVGFLVSFAVLLLAQPEGEWWVLGFVIIVIANDTGAYAVGVAIGRHPMVPTVSPKKSWEGAAGGTAAALLAGFLVGWLMLDQPWWYGIVVGAVLVVTGTAGDLLESSIKRWIGIKDMSSWLPGHGGVLDRLDSLILSAPFAYLLAIIAPDLSVVALAALR